MTSIFQSLHNIKVKREQMEAHDEAIRLSFDKYVDLVDDLERRLNLIYSGKNLSANQCAIISQAVKDIDFTRRKARELLSQSL